MNSAASCGTIAFPKPLRIATRLGNPSASGENAGSIGMRRFLPSLHWIVLYFDQSTLAGLGLSAIGPCALLAPSCPRSSRVLPASSRSNSVWPKEPVAPPHPKCPSIACRSSSCRPNSPLCGPDCEQSAKETAMPPPVNLPRRCWFFQVPAFSALSLVPLSLFVA